MKTHLPSATIWPAALALGVTLAALGAITTPVLAVAGAAIAAWALVAWIRLLLEEEEHR